MHLDYMQSNWNEFRNEEIRRRASLSEKMIS